MRTWQARLGAEQALFEKELERLSKEDLVNRIWVREYQVWSDSPVEISNRLGWLDIHERMKGKVPDLHAWARQMYSNGLRQAVVIGMGGSSLAPEVFSKLIQPAELGFALNLFILDTTDPAQIAALDAKLELKETLFLVATKSGGTVETLSGYAYYKSRFQRELPEENLGSHFVGITDPGSSLISLAQIDQWQRVFESDPNIGGRYSALSYFGLVPLALLGKDVGRFLQEVDAASLQAQTPLAQNDAARLGVFLAFQAARGRDKLTLMLPPTHLSFGDWAEQLVAESLGKSGKGILPVLGEGMEELDAFGSDRCCVLIESEKGDSKSNSVAQQVETLLVHAGHPTVIQRWPTFPNLGAAFFQWEFAVAVAGHCMGVHPFDQPDVESAKKATRSFLDAYAAKGELPANETVPAEVEQLQQFLDLGSEGDYISLQAYLPLNGQILGSLECLRKVISRKTKLATTMGIGPRFLHSTGQMHKGGPNSGLFIQFVKDPVSDLDIPVEKNLPAMSFGTLQAAQALGDAQALRAGNRRVLRMQVEHCPVANIKRLTEELERIW